MKRFVSYVLMYIGDSKIRFSVGILLGLLLNSFYIVFNIIYGIILGNVWFLTVAAYYLLIAVFRYLSLDGDSDLGSESVVSALMLALAFPMTGMIIYTALTSSSSGYPTATLPVFLIYSVFSILRAAVGIAAARARGERVRRNIHIIRLSSALMSLFNLQTSLLSFLGIPEMLASGLNFLTGGAISLSMLTLAAVGGKG